MSLTIRALLTSLALFATLVLSAQTSPYDVKVGNPLRKIILNTIRTPSEAELGQKVEFLVSNLRAKGNWVFINGMLQQPGGAAIDLNKMVDSGYLEAAQAGVFDHNFQALLQKKKGKWVILERALGCTDVCWLAWMEKKGVPKSVFPD